MYVSCRTHLVSVLCCVQISDGSLIEVARLRCHLVLVNNLGSAWGLMYAVHEGPEEICLHYTGWPGNTCERENLDWWNECKYVRLSERMFNYVRNLFGDPNASFTQGCGIP